MLTCIKFGFVNNGGLHCQFASLLAKTIENSQKNGLKIHLRTCPCIYVFRNFLKLGCNAYPEYLRVECNTVVHALKNYGSQIGNFSCDLICTYLPTSPVL